MYMGLRRVVVTGLGTINPLGKTVEEYFSNLDKGVSGARLITSFDTTLFKTRFACTVEDFDPSRYGIERKELRRIDRFAQFAMAAAATALADSGLDLQKIDLDRAGVILGSGIGGIESLTEGIMDYCAGGCIPRFSPFLITKMISDMAPGLISIKYGFAGPNYTTTSACASSSHAMGDALNLIRLGKADIILTGGAEAPVSVPSIGGFDASKALSTNNDEYATASRPLMSADAYHITAPLPDGSGAVKVMRLALEDAGLRPEDVDYINVHGTSTPLGDVAELKAVKSLFGEYAYNLNISSTKSMHGHLLGAAGAVEALACIHAIRDSIVPPTINFRYEDPDIDYNLNLTLNKAQKRTVKVALNNTFGFGGHNSCLVFKAF